MNNNYKVRNTSLPITRGFLKFLTEWRKLSLDDSGVGVWNFVRVYGTRMAEQMFAGIALPIRSVKIKMFASRISMDKVPPALYILSLTINDAALVRRAVSSRSANLLLH